MEGIDLVWSYEQDDRKKELIQYLVQKCSDSNDKVKHRANETIVSKYKEFKDVLENYPEAILFAHAEMMASTNNSIQTASKEFIK